MFDKERVYSAVNANELNKGDLVYFSDNLLEIKQKLNDKFFSPKILVEILSEENSCRFQIDGFSEPYALAYLVCPICNVEAYKAWHSGQEIECCVDGVWKKWENLTPDWTKCKYRPGTKKRPFKDSDELITCFKQAQRYKDNNDIIPTIWIMDKKFGSKQLITAYYPNAIIVNGSTYTMAELLKHFVFIDGTHCGV